VRDPVKIGNVDQLNGRRGHHAPLAGRHRVGAQIAFRDQRQATVRGVIEIGAVGTRLAVRGVQHLGQLDQLALIKVPLGD
jgi:hypothetical protein